MDSSLHPLNVSLSQPLDNEDGSDYDLKKMCQILADNPEKAFQIRKQKILNLIQANNLQKNSHCFKFNDLSKPQDSPQMSEIVPNSCTKSAKQNSYRSLNASRGTSPRSVKLASPSHIASRNFSVQSGRNINRSISPSVKSIDLQKVSAHNVTCLSKRSQVKIIQKREETKNIQPKDILRLKESFYNRTTKWKENSTEKAEKQKEIQDMSLLKECTFTPKIIKGQSKTDVSYSNLYDRSFVWKENIQQRNQALYEIQNEKQLQVCTFQPITNANLENTRIDPLSIYNRNTEWKTQIQNKLRQSKETSRPASAKRAVPLPATLPVPLHTSQPTPLPTSQPTPLPQKYSPPLKESKNDSEKNLKIEKDFMDLRYLKLTDMLDSISKQIEACISKDC